MSDILSNDIARTATFGALSVLNIQGREVALKTGTTNNNKDAWTIGYTPSVAVGVWVGNNNNKPMKKGGIALAGPIWNNVVTEALKNTPIESFNKPNPIDSFIPPILRGFWQGGDTFTIDSISNSLATEYTPEDLRKEISITNVHSVLYWLDKNNPLEKKSGLINDSQYENWEYGVQKWWNSNKYKYTNITTANMPLNTDNIHTANSKPILNILGLEKINFNKDDNITISINSIGKNQIKKIDVFLNNTYITSLKSYPYTTTFSLNTINNLSDINIIKVIGVDVFGNIGEEVSSLNINNI